MTVQNNAWLSSTTAAAGSAPAARSDSIESPGRFAALLDRAQDAPARSRDSALGNAFEVREAQRQAPQAPRETARTPDATMAARAQDGAPRQPQNTQRANSERPRDAQRPNGERAGAERTSQQRGSEGGSDAMTAENAAPADGEATNTTQAASADGATAALPGAPAPGSTDLMNWLERLSAQADAAPGSEGQAGSPLAALAAGSDAAAGSAPAASADLGAATEILGGAMLAGTAVPGASSEAAAGSTGAARIETAPIAGASGTHASASTQRSHEAAAAPGEAQVPVPMDSPEFPQLLSSQISAFAREGVHEARLTLNPAEMGPVAVRIVVDGKDAQVAFHASQAATRSALEASLPTLAASLQDAGLTLSGGGVFDQAQAQQQRQDDRHGGNRSFASGGDAGEDLAVSGRATRHERPRGLLDMYA